MKLPEGLVIIIFVEIYKKFLDMFWNWGSFRKLELVQKDAERERVEI